MVESALPARSLNHVDSRPIVLRIERRKIPSQHISKPQLPCLEFQLSGIPTMPPYVHGRRGSERSTLGAAHDLAVLSPEFQIRCVVRSHGVHVVCIVQDFEVVVVLGW